MIHKILAAGFWASWALSAAAQLYQPVLLGNYGKDAVNHTDGRAEVISEAGSIGGYVFYPPGGAGYLAPTLWPSGGTTPMRLDDLGPNNIAPPFNDVTSLDSNGLGGGYVQTYADNGALRTRAVLWPAGGTAMVQLNDFGTNPDGRGDSAVHAIDNTGNAFGFASKYINGGPLSSVAVKWPAGQVTPVELPRLSDDAAVGTASVVNAVNLKGDLFGYAEKIVSGADLGTRAVRWTNTGSTIQELPTLAPDTGGRISAAANAVNNNGIGAGFSTKFNGDAPLGTRPVQWSADGTQIVELGVLSHAGANRTEGVVNGINSNGDRVGVLTYYSGIIPLANEAVIWPAGSNTPISLNSLIPPDSGWYLSAAQDINDAGVIVGGGAFDPDGSGPIPRFSTAFRLDPVPEPPLLPAAAIVGFFLKRRRR